MYLRLILMAATLFLFSFGGGSASSEVQNETQREDDYSTLREATEAKDGIFIGSLYNDRYMHHDADSGIYKAAMSEHFNMMSLEYSVSMDEIWVNEHTIDFTKPDKAFDYARENDMAVRVTHLLWYSTVPEWLSTGSYTDTEAEALVQGYIQNVMTHYITNYPDVYTEWNVVNEAVSAETPTELRDNFFTQKLGSDYIAKAFQWAGSVSPSAKLFINDYGCLGSSAWNKSRKETLIAIVSDLSERGIHLDGIGFQGHFSIDEYESEIADIKADFADFAELGVELQFTELDIRINDDVSGISDAKTAAQTEFYKDIFRLCVDTPECTAVTLWGLADQLSFINTGYADWLTQLEDWPLLIDENMLPKDVYDEIINILADQ